LKTQNKKWNVYIKKKQEQVLWCCNNIVKVNATNNEDAQWNIVEETNQKKRSQWYDEKKLMLQEKKINIVKKKGEY